MSTAESSFRVAQAQENTPLGPTYKSTAKPKGYPTPEEQERATKPMVLISGAGISGLTLAVLLHKAGVPFLVFERSKEVKPIGSFICLGAMVGPLFKQLGIYDEFVQLGKRIDHCEMYTEDLKPQKDIDIRAVKKITGYDQYVISRPQLYDLLSRQLPPRCIMLGKHVLTTWQYDNGVIIRCSDKSVYHGDILVGADGTYSAVRQSVYKEIKLKGDLPACDNVDLPFRCIYLVGQTLPLDPEEFPALKQDDSECVSVLGRETYYTWLTFTTKQNTICWMVIQFLNKDTKEDNDAFRNSEWGWEDAFDMARKVPGLRNGKPMTLEDYIRKTPIEHMSKVMLEEIVFQTWYKGRTVLMGDGVGAAHAIHDAVALANWISTLRKPTVTELETVFEEYRTERHPVVKEAFCYLPNGSPMIVKKAFLARYQVSFLPLVEDTGNSKPRYQASLHKTLEILKEQQGLTGAEIIARKVPEPETKKTSKASSKRGPEVASTATSASVPAASV
ncbi:hypothetical protein BGZ94_003217 [Podila epigama]|nr:hypothetical protein BGZ94_003217 [Podila epigama]